MKKLGLNLLFLTLLVSCSQEHGFQSLSSFSTGDRNLASEGGFSTGLETEFFQLSNKQASIDFLIIPDSSKSMFPHLNSLGGSLSDLLYVISDYDWQMAFSSTDHGDYQYNSELQDQWQSHVAQGKGRFGTLMSLENGVHFLSTKILSSRVSNYEKVFMHSLSHLPKVNCNRPPFCSSPLEQPLRSLKSAIERAFLSNRPLFRSSSEYFVSILISNEDERKEDRQRATSPDDVIFAFNRQFQNSNKKFLHYSIVIEDHDCLQKELQNSPSAALNSASIQLSEQTAGPGSVISLCSKNYGSSLQVISNHIKNQVENSFLLKKKAIPSSVKMSFTKGPQLSWTLRGKEILFDNKNYENIEGIVSYQALR